MTSRETALYSLGVIRLCMESGDYVNALDLVEELQVALLLDDAHYQRIDIAAEGFHVNH